MAAYLIVLFFLLLSNCIIIITKVECQLIIDDPEYREHVRAAKYYARNEVPTSGDQQESTIANWCGERFGKSNEKCVNKVEELCNVKNENFTQTCPFLLKNRRHRQKRTPGRAEKATKQDLSTLQGAFNQFGQQFLATIFGSPKATSKGPQGDVMMNDAKSPQTVVTNNELSVNNPDNYFHGDTDLSKGQANYLMGLMKLGFNALFGGGNNGGGKRRKRKVGRDPAYHLWTENPIPYQFAANVPQNTRNVIQKAINLWQSNTCRRWAKDILGEDRVEFVNGDGCSSFVGKTGGVQEISIMTPGCDVVGIASHEIGHSLGFFHEQGRPDQSSNVVINKANIQPARLNNFVPMPAKDVNTYNLAYDYGSVMHYDSLTKGFTYNQNKYSIITKDDEYQHTIGQRIGPSFIDYKLVNLAYCSEVCQRKLGCTHGGYEDPNNCNQCKCPTGFGGQLCNTVAASTAGCGGVIKLTGGTQVIQSPNYPSQYPKNTLCNWYILAPPNGKIYLQFEAFAMPCDEVCTFNYVEVKRSTDFERTGYRLCCDKVPKQLVSETNEMIIIFSTNDDSHFRTGFKAHLSTDGRGAIVVPVPVAPGPLVPTLPPVIGGGGDGGSGGTGPVNPSGCQCGQWSGWTSCSQPCGGCGYVRRQRSCNGQNCYSGEKKHCNFQQCSSGTNVLLNNGQFDIVFNGCCVGFIGVNGQCGGLNQAVSQFFTGLGSGK